MSKTECMECSPAGHALAEPIPLEDAGNGGEIAAKIRDGKAVLEVVSTPWGIEFYVREVLK